MTHTKISIFYNFITLSVLHRYYTSPCQLFTCTQSILQVVKTLHCTSVPSTENLYAQTPPTLAPLTWKPLTTCRPTGPFVESLFYVTLSRVFAAHQTSVFLKPQPRFRPFPVSAHLCNLSSDCLAFFRKRSSHSKSKKREGYKMVS